MLWTIVHANLNQLVNDLPGGAGEDIAGAKTPSKADPVFAENSRGFIFWGAFPFLVGLAIEEMEVQMTKLNQWCKYQII